MTSFTIRKAKENELAWINQTYQNINFAPSVFDNEFIAIAETQKQEKIGIGRLVQLDSKQVELGGMFVTEKFRQQGVAGQIVEFLLKHAFPYQTVYCLPFHHLESFYQSFGFTPVAKSQQERIPQEIQKKHQWCQGQYSQKVTLLYLRIQEAKG